MALTLGQLWLDLRFMRWNPLSDSELSSLEIPSALAPYSTHCMCMCAFAFSLSLSHTQNKCLQKKKQKTTLHWIGSNLVWRGQREELVNFKTNWSMLLNFLFRLGSKNNEFGYLSQQ